MEKPAVQADADVHITFEDQQKINKFARLNAQLEDLKDEIRRKQDNLKNLEDASDEVLLMDEDEKVPFQIGEVFLYQDIQQTQKCLEEVRRDDEEDIKILNSKADAVKELMSDLKTQLYGKFGNNINLEAEEE